MAVLLSSPTAAAQGKVYTRKARLADFPTRTTKVVSAGNSFLDIAFRKEISTRWRISPYEFCTPDYFDSQKENSSLYFLYLGTGEGITFIVLCKGGKEDKENNLGKPFEVARIPICSAGFPSGHELMYMGAFIDILQAYVEDAMVSDKAAYAGMSWFDRPFQGKTICLDTEMSDELYMQGESDTLISVIVSPEEPGTDNKCYKMLISADTHEMYYFKESPFKKGDEAAFTRREIKQFGRKNGIIGEQIP